MKVDTELVQGISHKVLEISMELAMDKDKTAAFFEVGPQLREKRVQLTAQLERLKKAQEIINTAL